MQACFPGAVRNFPKEDPPTHCPRKSLIPCPVPQRYPRQRPVHNTGCPGQEPSGGGSGGSGRNVLITLRIGQMEAEPG